MDEWPIPKQELHYIHEKQSFKYLADDIVIFYFGIGFESISVKKQQFIHFGKLISREQN